MTGIRASCSMLLTCAESPLQNMCAHRRCMQAVLLRVLPSQGPLNLLNPKNPEGKPPNPDFLTGEVYGLSSSAPSQSRGRWVRPKGGRSKAMTRAPAAASARAGMTPCLQLSYSFITFQ